MPLLDLFHPPLNRLARWESVHSAWCVEIMKELNRVLPPRFVALTNIHLGNQLATDIAEFEYTTEPEAHEEPPQFQWSPPTALQTIEFDLLDDFHVEVRDQEDDRRLLAVIEIISPANKDRPRTQTAFVNKCAAYLHQGMGLIVVDTITHRHANLHNQLLQMLDQADHGFANQPPIYAVAYQPLVQEGHCDLKLWPHTLQVDQPLPTLPLALRSQFFVPVDLEKTFQIACEDNRLRVV